MVTRIVILGGAPAGYLPNCSRPPQSTRQVSNGPPDAYWTAPTHNRTVKTHPSTVHG